MSEWVKPEVGDGSWEGGMKACGRGLKECAAGCLCVWQMDEVMWDD